MSKILKVFAISTGCNVVSNLGKMLVNMDFKFKGDFKWVELGITTAISYLTNTVPALVGYGVGSLVDNGFGKQVLSVPVALGLTAGAECLAHDVTLQFVVDWLNNGGWKIEHIKPKLDNFTLWSKGKNVTLNDNQIKVQQYEMIDFANTFIQTELFNIFLPDAVDAPEVLEVVNVT